jgi:hypothetical protein
MISTRSIVPSLALVPLLSLLVTAGCGDSSTSKNGDSSADVQKKPDVGGPDGQGGAGGTGGSNLDASGDTRTDVGGAGGEVGGNNDGAGADSAAADAPVGDAGNADSSDGPSPDSPIIQPDASDGPADAPIHDLGNDVHVDVGNIPDAAIDTVRLDTPGVEAAPPCVSGQSCTLAAGGSGLCRSNVCVACVDPTDDNACVTTYGASHICSGGQCVAGTCHSSTGCTNGKICGANHNCGDCATDAACKADSAYGTSRICLNTSCVVGNCHDRTSDCSNGRICNTNNHTCSACSTTNQCTATGAYGTGYFCSAGGACVQGNCQNSTECPAGAICGVTTTSTCGPCTTDSQCKNDTRYGATYICRTAAGASQGTCVSQTCTGTGTACAANPADICCGNACVAGTCCTDAQCSGANGVCVNNTCTSCGATTGNQYFVDPVNGNDTAATGSGKTAGGTAEGSCSFKTVTRALAVVGTSAPTGTTITIVGSTTGTTNLVGEASTIQVPANVKITTSVGPVRLALSAGAVGFQLVGAAANLAPIAAAPLTIDGGANKLSGWGVRFTAAGGAAAISNVTITNTGLHGIQVDSGTVNIGPGVTVTAAGTTTGRQNGLEVLGGTVNITVPAGSAATSFSNNTDDGIHVSGTGSLNITGVQATATTTPSTGTVVVNGNYNAGIEFEQDPSQTAPSLVDGLVAWGSTSGLAGHGIVIHGGSKVTLRRSIALHNSGSGVDIVASTDATASVDTSKIDLGISSDFGRNFVQATGAATRNADAGICVELATGTHVVNAAGNVFAASNCSSTNQPALTHAYPCSGAVDIGSDPAATTTVSVDDCTLATTP